jgi:hypothetical protein
MPKPHGPKLTKAELAALDFLIADAKERPESGMISTAFWTAFAREALLFAVRQLIRARLQRFLIDDLGPIRKGLSETQLADLNKRLQEVVLSEPTMEQLLELRNSLEIKD